MADTLAKEPAQDEDEQNIVYDRIPTTTAATELKEGRNHKVAETMGTHCEGGVVQIILPYGGAKAKSETTHHTGVHCYGHRSRKDKVIFAQIQINGQPDVPL